jgi:hemoglobin
MGEEAGVRRLVDRFYDHMDSLPEAAGIRAMHQPDLASARQKLFEFLSGWLGGPSLYIEKYGHPRLRARHLPFPIATSERDQWMLCMDRALGEVVDDAEFRHRIHTALAGVADHMRNREA